MTSVWKVQYAIEAFSTDLRFIGENDVWIEHQIMVEAADVRIRYLNVRWWFPLIQTFERMSISGLEFFE